MKSAHAIVGANYGDCGKGIMTEYICAQEGADVVVRFNGGCNAGHTVNTPEGERHVFKHYGSGGFLGVPTFLSRFFVVNPLLFVEEGFPGKVFVDPRCLVTTPVDMFLNQAVAKRNGHGTCGVGINETVLRSVYPGFRITVADLFNTEKYRNIVRWHLPNRLHQSGLDSCGYEEKWRHVYLDCAKKFLNNVTVTENPPGDHAVFEGAQGLCLDQNSPDFPHVTRSNTGIKNVLTLCREWDIQTLHPIYTTRSFLTRHGAGPLPGETERPEWLKDDTNVDNEWQGKLRYAPLNIEHLKERINKDAGGFNYSVAVTCMDQFDNREIYTSGLPVKYVSHGPTRNDVKEI